MTFAALAIRTNDDAQTTIEDVALLADADCGFDLAGLYAAIGRGCTNVECIDFAELGITMWIDGEGVYNSPDHRNHAAAALYVLAYPHPEMRDLDVRIVGDVVLTGLPDERGDTRPIGSEAAMQVQAALMVGAR